MADRTIIDFIDRVLPGQFTGESWRPWRVVLKATFALPLDAEELAVYAELTGRTEAPVEPARELWTVVGRRAGKSITAALLAVYAATCRTYRFAPGERGVFMLLAADRRQARVLRRYVEGLLRSSPVLEQLIANATKDAIELTSGIDIEIHTSNYRSVRGYSLIGAALDELAFWPTEDSSNPDRETIAALRPALATVPGSLLVCLSSPYARTGELYRAHERHFGRVGSPVLVVKAPTRALNSTVPQEEIDRALEEDAAVAASEWLGEFRSDIESFVTRDVVDAVTVDDRFELPPVRDRRYVAFLDFAGGSGRDSATLAIAHHEKRDGLDVAVLDLVREIRPPFSPELVCIDFAAVLKQYSIYRTTADRFAADFAVEAMRRHGAVLEPAKKTKSDLYRELLPLLNSGRVELLDNDRLHQQLVGLERRTARGGKDSIDHSPGGRDDVANAVAGALVAAASKAQPQGGAYTSLPWHEFDSAADTLQRERDERALRRQRADYELQRLGIDPYGWKKGL